MTSEVLSAANDVNVGVRVAPNQHHLRQRKEMAGHLNILQDLVRLNFISLQLYRR